MPEIRPNITFQTYQCPEAYAKWYCLNGATCFFVRIGESILYNCECADGYMGQRCEFKDLEGSYLRKFDLIFLKLPIFDLVFWLVNSEKVQKFFELRDIKSRKTKYKKIIK